MTGEEYFITYNIHPVGIMYSTSDIRAESYICWLKFLVDNRDFPIFIIHRTHDMEILGFLMHNQDLDEDCFYTTNKNAYDGYIVHSAYDIESLLTEKCEYFPADIVSKKDTIFDSNTGKFIPREGHIGDFI